ncbi:hypothetical protein BH10BAC1_BH10BAC1_09890 [soil metagenome]
MHKKIFILLILLLPLLSYSQKTNRFKNKERQGKWIIYTDSTQKQIDNVGRYRKGIPKGIWKYYNEDGHIIRKEKYRFKKINTSYYHPNGKVKKQGKAKIVQEEKTLHFFYYGDWLVYDSTGTLIKKQVYENGIKISETNYKSKTEASINDSLVDVLRTLNKNIYKYHDSVNIAESTFGKNSAQYQRAVSLNALHTSTLLDQLNDIISKFGYPGKTLVGKEYAIAFSIISAANIEYKEKYYNTIIEEANLGELDWTDVAFFVDKVKVAKKEKQVYGTQYKIDEQTRKLLYYPTENLNNLNERRKKVGLYEEVISEMEFIEY